MEQTRSEARKDIKETEGVEEMENKIEETVIEEVETKETIVNRAKKFVKDHKVAVGATALGIGAAVLLAMKARTNEEDDILDLDYDEVTGTFSYDEGYKNEEEVEAE